MTLREIKVSTIIRPWTKPMERGSGRFSICPAISLPAHRSIRSRNVEAYLCHIHRSRIFLHPFANISPCMQERSIGLRSTTPGTEYADCGEQREEIAHRIAWAAVKHRYPQGTKRVGAAVSGSFRCFDRDQIFPVTIGHMSRNQAPKVNSAP